MRRFHIYIGFIVWLLTSLFAVSCTDELEGNGYSFNSSSNLHVLVPTVLSANGDATRGSSSEVPTYNATVDECQINDLRLYAFPVNNEGKLIAENLPAPLASMMLNEKAAEYQLTITPGTYHIYVVANLNDVLSGQHIDTEDKLKKVVLHYGSVGKPGMPVCTNIPMIYEPEKDATTGELVETKITPAGNKYTEVIADMKFTCVKVKLNLIFDPTQEDVKDNFGGKSILIDSIVANKLSPFTNLYWGGKFAEESLADGEYKTGFSSKQYTSGSDAPAVYYTDWEDHTLEAEANNKNDIVGKGNPTPAPIDAAKKWLFQSTYYLPERYISSAADRSYLTINGKVANSASNDYRIDLGHKKDETNTSEVPTFPRGTYYEITGRIKSLGNMELNCNVSIKPWESPYIYADFNHTTLWVSKAEASVTSTTTDFINYESNATITPENIGCETKIDGKDLIIPELDMLTKQIKLKINKDINYSAYSGVYTGTAKVWIKAGNITKYIDVKYDVKPYFDVTPQEITIYSGSDKMTNIISFNTNLGGLEFTDGGTTYSHSASEAISSISYKNGSGETITSSITANSVTGTDQGTFSIKADQGVETSITHTIYVQPRGYTTGKYGAEYDFKKPIKITVKPAVGNYYIYLRVINDRTPYCDDSNKSGNRVEKNYDKTLDEGDTNNWNDGWFDLVWSGEHDKPQELNHLLYAYTQIGETDGKSDKVWKFTKNWPGDKMNADYANPGWYYSTFDVNKLSISHDAGVDGNRKIKPGETLLMFNNGFNPGIGYAAHRCPHYNEPGIPLFDYEDHEGWIVIDPTTDALWQAYDEKPEIENIKITIYTQFEIYGWFIEYGIAANGQFIMFDKEGNTYTKSTVGSWHKTVITLKAIKGEHEKSIKLYTTSEKKTDQSIILFNGRSFKDDTGYYEGGKWYQGKPKGVTE
ncbi:hypothetical protein [Segatella copri]|uniref:hypothetical protein n=1 Tax=Segatella copri TaxID=165179 RepID=UPI00294B49CE|nr:hypothetical protein [Segatella copri]